MYKNKYIKYKKKYLNLLKGGEIPQIDCDLLPFEKKDINIIYQGQFILQNNEDLDKNYLLNSEYQFEKTNLKIRKPLFNISDLSMLANLSVQLGSEFIPFHVGSLQFNFNIIIGLLQYLESKIKGKKKFFLYIKEKIFNIKVDKKLNDNDIYIFVDITKNNTILNCFSFFNKLHELLNYLLLNDYDEQIFNSLFPNIENIKDFYNIYSEFYYKKDKKEAIIEYLQLGNDKFYDDIIKLKKFIINCNSIDKNINFKLMFGISLINLILINWIYLRIFRTKLVIGSFSANLYPISTINFFENIFQMNEENIYCYIEQQKQLNKKNEINTLLLKKIEVPIVPYGQSTYNGNSFPNCVENTILQLLKILAWNDNKYFIELLPTGISENIKNIIRRINVEPLKKETNKIMDDFVILLSNIPNIEYNKGNHDIVSNIGNIGKVLNYVLNNVNPTSKSITNYNQEIFNKINEQSKTYNLIQKNNIIIIKKNSFEINIIINNGHASIEDKINDIYKFINTYKYINMLYTFNYSKDDSINFNQNFKNFCKKQNKDIQYFIIKKIINIQNINLDIKNSKDERGNTCYHIACEFDNVEILREFIIKNYADIDSVDNTNNTPLLLASIKSYYECVKLLIENGADVNKASNNDYTPIIVASENGNSSLVELLFENGADINKTNKANNTPLLIASKNGHCCCVELLIKNGAIVNKDNHYGDTPLLVASENGHCCCVELLIENGADINKTNKANNTPLLVASKNGHSYCVDLLLKNGADINKASNDGNTPLLVAFKNSHSSCVELLIKNGADVKVVNENNQSALFLASANGFYKYIDLLIKYGADINTVDKIFGYTSLIVASQNGHSSCVELLIKNGADVNKSSGYNATPLLLASQNGHSYCVELLIKNGADVNKADKSNNTPLIMASQNGHSCCVELLIKNGADVNMFNQNGNSPLLLASKKDYYDCVKLLIENCADVNKVDINGKSSFFYASLIKDSSCLKLLIEYGKK
jgi:ankyrin repeat protein